MESRVSRVEGALDGMKHGQVMLMAVAGLVAAIMIGGFAVMVSLQLATNARIDSLATTLNARIDDLSATLNARTEALTATLTTEFANLRAEQAATTSAIANSITAARQQAPQVILVPPPQPAQPQP